MVFAALGDTDEIGASCHFLRLGETGLLLDAGADPEEEGEDSLPRYDLIHARTDWYVDHAIITHAHHDHVGSLPVLIREFPHVQVHMTRATRDLTDFVLPASARLQRRKLREGSTSAPPLFGEEELELHSYLYNTHELEEDFDLTGERPQQPVTGRFYNAGHILGSAGVLLRFQENGAERTVFYTSDTNLRPQSIIPGGSYPDEPVDVLVLESTTGADPEAELTTRRREEKKFGAALKRVLERGGTVLVPVFALGRAQEILAVIDRLKQQGVVGEDIPVYTAGSMRAVADLYDKTRFVTPRLDPGFQVFGVQQRRLPRSSQAKRNALSEPSIHVVSSGMMFQRTLSNLVGQHLVSGPKNGIFLVGFAKEDSPAYRLLEAAASDDPEPEVVLDPAVGEQPVRCDVERFRFSGHSHRRDLLQIVEKLRPKKIVLVHGEEDARSWMEDNITFFYPEIEIHRPKLGEPIDL